MIITGDLPPMTSAVAIQEGERRRGRSKEGENVCRERDCSAGEEYERRNTKIQRGIAR